MHIPLTHQRLLPDRGDEINPEELTANWGVMELSPVAKAKPVHHKGRRLNPTGARFALAYISNQDESPASYIHTIHVSFAAITGLFTRLKKNRIIDAHRII